MTPDVGQIQRRTLRLLFLTQVIGGIGMTVGASVGALLAAELAGIGLSGAAQSANVVGAALFALPATAIVHRHGRRPSLAAGYAVGAIGALLVLVAAVRASVPLLFAGLFLFGGVSAAGYQARYAAVDLAPVASRGRHLSLVVWATTLGAIVGPGLAAPTGATLARYGVPTLAGPFFLSALLFALSSLLLVVLLRPDPAVIARREAGAGAAPVDARRSGVRAALPVIVSEPSARLGVGAMAIGHVVMVGVMTMAPVHVRSAGHDAAHTLRIVGVVLSAHIAGMFAFAPAFGWLTDRYGRRPVVGAGLALLLAACAVTGTAGHDPARLAAGLMLLGLGWSATMVAGSTMLSDTVSGDLRASAQGVSDLVMGLAGASAGAISGVIVEGWGYPRLTLLAAIATVPLAGLLLAGSRRTPSPHAASVES
ncbi:MAG TPA: MFS transporter [Gemmatimonadales bacterium]|nr:MFS transporter [Gemmatimonadales bacterium]